MNENNNNQDEVDLSGMLKGYSKKSELFQDWQQRKNLTPQKSSVMARLLIKYSGGLVRDERQAQYIFIIFTVLIFIVSLILFLKTGLPNSPGNIKVLPA